MDLIKHHQTREKEEVDKALKRRIKPVKSNLSNFIYFFVYFSPALARISASVRARAQNLSGQFFVVEELTMNIERHACTYKIAERTHKTSACFRGGD